MDKVGRKELCREARDNIGKEDDAFGHVRTDEVECRGKYDHIENIIDKPCSILAFVCLLNSSSTHQRARTLHRLVVVHSSRFALLVLEMSTNLRQVSPAAVEPFQHGLYVDPSASEQTVTSSRRLYEVRNIEHTTRWSVDSQAEPILIKSIRLIDELT